MKVRGLLAFGENPIPQPGITYNAWFADVTKLNEETYGKFKMLVRDFYTSDARAKFNALFEKVETSAIKSTIRNPVKALEANRDEVERLIEKYKDIGDVGSKGLEFHGSKHMAEGVVMFRDSTKKTDGTKGVINADEPRMGKTRQSIVGAIESGLKNNLVVTTKTAKFAVWPDQILAVDPRATITVADHKKYSARAQWTLIHWDALRLCDDRFFANAATFDLIILDEAHYACNEESQRGKATARLCNVIPWVWLLTGTPVTKRPKNLIHLLQLIRHPLVSTGAKVWHFLTRYCGDKDEWGRWDFKRSKNLDELNGMLQDVLIRRERSQTNLPPKVRQIQTVHLTAAQREAYDRCWEDYLEKPGKLDKSMTAGYPTAMVQTMVRRHAVAMLKVPVITDWAEDLIVAGKKVVVFTCFSEVYEAYMKHFGDRAVGIRGEVSPQDRATAVRRFQTDPDIDIIICNIIAAKEAIPLWAGYAMAFNDISWLPGDQLQAEDRIVGGDKNSCFINFFLAENTSDQEGFADFIKHKDIVQRIINRRDEDGNVIDPGFATELPVARATEGRGGTHDVIMTKLGRLMESGTVKGKALEFGESVLEWYNQKGTLTKAQVNAVSNMLMNNREKLKALGIK